MANHIGVDMRDAILGLCAQGWSRRRIARELGVHRKTIKRQLELADKSQSVPNLAPGSDPPLEPESGTSESVPNLAPGSQRSGPPSKCEPFREVIIEKLDAGLSAKRTWQDLRDEYDFKGRYSSVKLFVRRLSEATPIPFRRIETEPGEEAQVDFGTGAPLLMPNGRRKRTHVFRIVLSCSRRGYSKAVARQTTDEFLGALEDAFWHFGGVPRVIVLDNLKAAVTKADWYDPELNPKILSFAQHYGCVFLPTKPRMPRHKGKVERGIGYVQDNALRGRKFKTLLAQNAFLHNWEANVADVRIHGTTRAQVKARFDELERPALLPLPSERFANFSEASRIVQRDGFIAVAQSFYSVPPEYVTHRVWVRWDSHLVRIFNKDFKLIRTHARSEPGGRKVNDADIHSKKRCVVERGADFLLKRSGLIGEHAGRWAEHVFKTRGVAAMRVMQGLSSLANRHTSAAIDSACRRAISHGAYRLKDVRALIDSTEEQTEFEFMQEHPIIRNPIEYGRVVRADLSDGTGRIVPMFDKRKEDR